jgi:hypothetical protein
MRVSYVADPYLFRKNAIVAWHLVYAKGEAYIRRCVPKDVFLKIRQLVANFDLSSGELRDEKTGMKFTLLKENASNRDGTMWKVSGWFWAVATFIRLPCHVCMMPAEKGASFCNRHWQLSKTSCTGCPGCLSPIGKYDHCRHWLLKHVTKCDCPIELSALSDACAKKAPVALPVPRTMDDYYKKEVVIVSK